MTVMDLYGNRISPLREENEESFYCSPAYDSNDILCAGSDNEESTKEIHKKRKRYEDEARRYMRGYIPILHSANLKGPLDRASGWVNPWRFRPLEHMRVEDEGTLWRKEPQFNTAAQENMVKRAAENGLGYLTPAEALAWCKHSINTEKATAAGQTAGIAESIEPGETTKQIKQCVGQDALTMMVSRDRFRPQPGYTDCSTRGDSQSSRDADDKRAQANTITSTKRPANSGWLQGSYLSKRARWDGPSISSPSPLPNVTGSKCRQATTRIGPTTLNAGPESDSILFRSKVPVQEPETLLENTVITKKKTERRNRLISQDGESLILSSGTRSLFSKTIGKELCGKTPRTSSQSNGEYEKDRGESISTISFRYGSSPASHKPPPNRAELPVSHRRRSILTNKAVSPDHQHTSTVRKSKAASKQYRGASHTSVVDELNHTHEVSFITKIAPSCRDLEKFQYRLKQRLVDSKCMGSAAEHDHSRDGTPSESDAPRSESRSIVGRPFDHRETTGEAGDEWNATVEGLESSNVGEVSSVSAEKSISPVQMIRFASHSFNKSTELLVDLTVLREGENSDNDWDTIDDIFETPSFVDAATSSPKRARSSGLCSSKGDIRHSSSGLSPFEIQSNLSFADMENSAQEMNPRLSQSSSRPRPHTSLTTFSHFYVQRILEQELMQLAGEERATTTEDMAVNQDDISTQSLITIPTSSMIEPQQVASIHRIRPENTAIQDVNKGTEDHSLPPEGEQSADSGIMEDEMEAIQTALSQTCSGLNFEEKCQTEVNDSRSGWAHTNGMPAAEGGITESYVTDTTDEFAKKFQPGQKVSYTNLFNERTGGINAIDNQGKTHVHGLGTISSYDTSTVPHSAKEGDAEQLIALPPSEESWQGCGIQSPWVAEPTKALPKIFIEGRASRSQVAYKIPSESSNRGLSQDEGLQQPGSDYSETSPGILRFASTTPREELKTPKRLLKGCSKHEDNGITSTQLLVEAATNNPWDSSSKNVNLSKSKKRVSFGSVLSNEKANLQVHEAEPSPSYQHKLSSTSSFINVDQRQSVVHLDERVTRVDKPEDYPTYHLRTLKRILPQQSASQMHSSPAEIGAMAEAFISADRDMISPLDYERKKIASRSPIRRYKNLSATHDKIWSVTEKENDWSRDSFNCRGDDFTTTNFDMQAALGEMGDFLEDWSVEAELKKARGTSSKENVNGNSERRSLFGMV